MGITSGISSGLQGVKTAVNTAVAPRPVGTAYNLPAPPQTSTGIPTTRVQLSGARPTNPTSAAPGTGYNTGAGQTTTPGGYDMSTPGVGEQYYDKNQAAYQTGPGEAWWGTNGQKYNTPTAAETYYSQNAKTYAAPTASEKYTKNANQLTGPGAAAGFYDDYGSGFTDPNASSQYYDSTRGQYGQPGALDSYYGANKSQFTQPGQSGSFYTQNQDTYQQAGPGESYWSETAPNDFWQGGQGEQFWNQVAGSLGSHPGTTNNAQTAFSQAQSDRPNLSTDAGLTPYYDRAEQRTRNTLNQDAAARGVYGSSVAQGQVGDAISGLEAEKANREGQYELDRSANQREWDNSAGTLARGADTSSLAGSQNELGWTTGLGNLANEAQSGGLSRLLGAGGLAATAQNLGQNRLNAQEGAASDADQLGLSRLLGGGSLAGATQSADLNRLTAGQTAAHTSAGDTLNGLIAGMNASEGADASGVSRLLAGNTITGTGTDAELARLKAGSDAAGTASSEQLDRLNSGGAMANLTDKQELSRTNSGEAAAVDSEQLRNGRVQGAYDNQLKPVLAMLGISEETYKNMGQDEKDSIDSVANLLVGGATSQATSESNNQQRPASEALAALNALIQGSKTAGQAGAIA